MKMRQNERHERKKIKNGEREPETNEAPHGKKKNAVVDGQADQQSHAGGPNWQIRRNFAYYN
uniref:Uncharacterized protein n=1 Tax=Romanomermis culicivorax TaxID=13658 RepID=A0A915IXW8_ROMCU